MASITLKNIPDDLHRRLRVSAQNHRRSLTAEILSLLEAQIMSGERNPEGMLANIRRLHKYHPIQTLSCEEIERFKREGRP